MNLTTTEFSTIAPTNHVTDYVNAFRAGQALAAQAHVPQTTNSITGQAASADPADRSQALRRAELLGAIGVGLSGMAYSARLSVLAHLAPALENEGIPAAVVTSFDPTDEALSQSVDRARTVGDLLNAT